MLLSEHCIYPEMELGGEVIVKRELESSCSLISSISDGAISSGDNSPLFSCYGAPIVRPIVIVASDSQHQLMWQHQVHQASSSPPAPEAVQKKKKLRKGKLLLWQFLLIDLLRGHSDVSWHADQVNNPGVFSFRDPNAAAKRWGRYKENDNMSYEKMSRCVRDYYIRSDNRYHGVMLPDPQPNPEKRRRRLHFAFSLEHPCVVQFIRQHSAAYYHKLVNMQLISGSASCADK